MNITLRYGKSGLTVEFPDEWDVTRIDKNSMPVLEQPVEDLELALNRSVNCAPFDQLAASAKTACILVCDITRPVPNATILPVLIRRLLKAGIDSGNITLLVATGLHRPNEGDELLELLGNPWALETAQVENHFARNDADHVDLGTTSAGLPIKLDRRFVEADLKIVTGLVEPHFMAGFSGGRKVIMPGIAHQDTIRRFHTADFLEHPRAANCVLEGNPLHQAQLEIVRRLPPVMAVNTVIDDQRRMVFVNFGEIEASHQQAVHFLQPYVQIRVSKRFSTVVTSAGGYPLDKTYYQTVKGMVGAMDILAPEGNLVIVSECSEGMGSAQYVAAQKRLIRIGPDAFLASLKTKEQADIDEWQTEMQLKPMRFGTIHLFSEGLAADQWQLTGVNRVESLPETLHACVRGAKDRRVAVIPEGPYVLPVCGGKL